MEQIASIFDQIEAIIIMILDLIQSILNSVIGLVL